MFRFFFQLKPLSLSLSLFTLFPFFLFLFRCGPCSKITPVLSKFIDIYPGVVFAKVDVDLVEELADQFGISSMPTFFFFRNGENLGNFTGHEEGKVRQEIEKYL